MSLDFSYCSCKSLIASSCACFLISKISFSCWIAAFLFSSSCSCISLKVSKYSWLAKSWISAKSLYSCFNLAIKLLCSSVNLFSSFISFNKIPISSDLWEDSVFCDKASAYFSANSLSQPWFSTKSSTLIFLDIASLAALLIARICSWVILPTSSICSFDKLVKLYPFCSAI